MTDIVIGQAKGREIFIRDVDGDGTFDEGERIGVRGPGDRFDAARVEHALARVGIARLMPGARIPRIGAYIDCLNEADRMIGEGDFAGARGQLNQAEEFAQDNGILISDRRIGDLRWHAVERAVERGAVGASDLEPMCLSLLREDENAASRRISARLVLDYLSDRASIENIGRSAGLGRDRMLAENRAHAEQLATEIRARAGRRQTVATAGCPETVADMANASGSDFRVGDLVRQSDPETGETWGSAFVITGFEIRTGGVIAHGREVPGRTSSPHPHEVDIDCLAHVSEGTRAPMEAPTEARGNLDGLISRLDVGWSRFLSLFR